MSLKYKYGILSTLFFCVVLLFSCKKESKISTMQKILSEWIGKKIKFPQEPPVILLGNDSDYISSFNKPYKIVVYIDSDSVGCTSCKLKLFEWNLLISEINSSMKDSLSLLFYFHPQEETEIYDLVKRAKMEKFNHPIFYDKENMINKLNNFPTIAECQCFLLDKDNKVLVVGNPAIGTELWKLYKKKIYGKVI
jgi:hypothetical protein